MVITEIKGSLLKSHRKPFILLPIINDYHEPIKGLRLLVLLLAIFL
jgi:hypothetical protein